MFLLLGFIRICFILLFISSTWFYAFHLFFWVYSLHPFEFCLCLWNCLGAKDTLNSWVILIIYERPRRQMQCRPDLFHNGVLIKQNLCFLCIFFPLKVCCQSLLFQFFSLQKAFAVNLVKFMPIHFLKAEICWLLLPIDRQRY